MKLRNCEPFAAAFRRLAVFLVAVFAFASAAIAFPLSCRPRVLPRPQSQKGAKSSRCVPRKLHPSCSVFVAVR
uniref:Uncharacterized protein n=1 Tax=uncultured gamma proteobacterium HF0010_01E20 TaxID=710977 RepID=E0XQA4_9GAMM|nr:hypothetical protein [uncultured gamma proteobacterium HF0010_01E20]